MKFLCFPILLFGLVASAQPKPIVNIAETISVDQLKTNLYYLASDLLQGRLFASHGDTLASEFVAKQFKKNNLVAPYDKGGNYYQAITAHKILFEGDLALNGIHHPMYDGWFARAAITPTSQTKNAKVVFTEYDFGDTSYNNLNGLDIKNKVLVILLHGNPGSINASVESFENVLIKKGACAYMLIMPGMNNAVLRMIPNMQGNIPEYENILFIPEKKSTIPSMVLSPEMGDSLLMKDGQTIKTLQSDFFKSPDNKFFYSKSVVSLNFRHFTEEVKAPNVIGVIKGTDKNAGCVIVSAHHDHEGKQGSEIYYGAVDNASGTTAIIEMAALMNKCIKAGYRPKRTIIFASFTGEERGLLGSKYYSEHPLYPISKTYAVLNIDMMGRVDTFYSGKRADSNYAYILVKDSLDRGLRKAVYDANESGAVRLKLDTYYEQPEHAQRRITGSDQYPFYLKGVPFIRIDCGFAKDYHKPTDTPDKINYDLLKKQTQLAFLTLWNISNN